MTRVILASMARPTEWRRFVHEYVEGATKSNAHDLQLPSLAAGETLARIRFNWQALHSTPNAADATGLTVCMGIIVIASDVEIGTVPRPYDGLDEDWVWWEAPFFQPRLVSDSSGAVKEEDMAPAYDTYRDARAMRVADPLGSDVWFFTQTSDLAFGQSDHYLSVTGSMLVLLPA